MRERSRKWYLTRQMFGCILQMFILLLYKKHRMTNESSLDARMTVRVPHDLVERASERCKAEGLSLSVVVRTALLDYIRYGMDLSIRRAPPEEETTESIF